MKRKKSKTKRVEPEQPKVSLDKRKTRQITLPQEVIELAEMTHVSIPYQISANIKKVIFGFMFLLLWLIPIVFYVNDINASNTLDFYDWPLSIFLLLIVPCIGYWRFNYDKKSANHLPTLAYVTPTKLYVEDQQSNPHTKDTLITWARVTRTHYQHADIFFTNSYKGDFKYWNFADQNGLRKVDLSLTNNLTGPSMKNIWEINRAILANFAVHAKEPLAIASSLFVYLEINPITWQRDKQPKYTEWLFMGIAMLAMLVALFIFSKNTNPSDGTGYILGYGLLIVFITSIPIALFGYELSAKLFPEFYGDSIVFVAPKAPSTQSSFEQAINDFYTN